MSCYTNPGEPTAFHDRFLAQQLAALRHLDRVMYRSPAEANRDCDLSDLRGADGCYLSNEQADSVCDERRDREIEGAL